MQEDIKVFVAHVQCSTEESKYYGFDRHVVMDVPEGELVPTSRRFVYSFFTPRVHAWLKETLGIPPEDFHPSEWDIVGIQEIPRDSSIPDVSSRQVLGVIIESGHTHIPPVAKTE